MNTGINEKIITEISDIEYKNLNCVFVPFDHSEIV